MANPLLPPWLNSNANGSHRPPPPSVVLTLSSSTATASLPHFQTERGADNGFGMSGSQHMMPSALATVDSHIVSEIVDCCRDLEEGHKAWMAHKNEAAWRLKRVELQLESEKACKRREKMEEIEAKVRALREEQQIALERLEAEYREQILGLRRDAEAKEQKLAEQWAAKHMRLSKFLEQVGFHQWPPRGGEMNG